MESSIDRNEVLNSETTQFARKYFELKVKKDKLDQQVTDIEAEIDMVRTELTTKMEDIGLQTFKLEKMGTFYLQTTFMPKVLNDEKMIDWLDKHNQTNIAPRTIKKAALKEYWQEAMEKDHPIPPADLAEAYSETKVRLRKAKQ